MSKETSVVLLGVWIVVLPYLGIPGSWRTFLFIVSGIAIMSIGFLLRGDTLSRTGNPTRKQQYPFVEHTAEASQPSSHDNEGITSLN